MNSEELELSLRTEFESYLNDILAEMRQEVSGFQTKFQDEFEKHKSHLDDVFREFSSRLENDKHLDEGFRESVVEHLRLAKDEGARITASAIAEAEDREKENSEMLAASVSYSEIRDAISEISNQDTQAGILKSLVNQAAHFTPRGAFFIIKNEHFVGWRVFGKEGIADEQKVREIFFPMSHETILSEAVRSLSPVESNYGTYSDDSFYLDKLEFGQPDRMYAIPLVARGRGVAVLYADYGAEGVSVSIEALETLVRVAGLTVELLAASQGAKSQTTQSVDQPEKTTAVAETFQQPAENERGAAQNYQIGNEYGKSEPVQENYNSSFEQADTASEAANYGQTETNPNTFKTEPAADNFQTYYQEFSAAKDEKSAHPGEISSETDFSWNNPPNYSDKSDEAFVVEEFSSEDEKSRTAEFNYEAQKPIQDYSTTSSYDFETPSEQFTVKPQSEFEQPGNEREIPQFESSPNGYSEKVYEAKTDETPETYTAPAPAETASSVAATPVKSRLSERNVDLPIEVAEDERRLHNDARRFARLLVSEIKLYNEQKVKEGRESSDLYERLREAIDRSREMYEKRVQPPVAAKFDYFHYELINSLAEGDEVRLGRSYPGTKV